MVLWAMSLGAAVIILVAVGFGEQAWNREGWRRVWVVVGAGLVWCAGWLPAESWSHRWVVNPGVVAAGLAGGVLLIRRRDSRGAALAMVLGLVGLVVRLIAPFSFHQASVVPQAALESVGLGVAAGMGNPRPAAAAAVGVVAECVSSFLSASVHSGRHQVGLGDFAAVTLAALGAWGVAWLSQGVSASWKKLA